MFQNTKKMIGPRMLHTDLNTLDGGVFYRSAVRAVFFQSQCNAKDRSGYVRLGVEELKVSLQSSRLLFFCGVKSFDRGDHGIAPSTVLHTFIVPGTLEESRTKTYGPAIRFC